MGYRLSGRADAELLDIFVHGCRMFGIPKARAYAAELERTFALLAANPKLGRSAAMISPGLRRHEHGRHVILYEEDPEGVVILAIVHDRRMLNL